MERFTTASLALQEVVQLLNPDRHVPMSLFPHNVHAGRLVRLGQLMFGALQLFALGFAGNRGAVIYGPGLAYQNGWVRISLEPNWRIVANALVRLQPVIFVPMPDGELPEFFTRTGMNPIGLSSFLNQNGHPLIRGTRDDRPSIVHYGRAPASKTAVGRHADGLAGAHARLGTVLSGLLPIVHAERHAGVAALLIQQELDGREPPIPMLSDQQLDRMATAALAPLGVVHRHFAAELRPFDMGHLDRGLAGLLAALPDYRQHIEPSVGLLQRWISARLPLCIPAHGDYAPRNLLFDAEYSRIVGIVDWEWFWEDGIVGFDALKLILEISADRERTTLIGSLARFLRTRAVHSSLHRQLEMVRDMYSLSDEDLRHISILIWLRVLWMGCVETDPSTPAWLEDTVMTPARAISATMQAV